MTLQALSETVIGITKKDEDEGVEETPASGGGTYEVVGTVKEEQAQVPWAHDIIRVSGND